MCVRIVGMCVVCVCVGHVWVCDNAMILKYYCK